MREWSRLLYCNKCHRYTDGAICPICGQETSEEVSHVIYWCDTCGIPIIHTHEETTTKCPICGEKAKFLCVDLRPVFPEERLFFEVLEGDPLAHVNDSVWAMGSRYYVNGKPVNISIDEMRSKSVDEIREKLSDFKSKNDSSFFEKNIKLFIEANAVHLSEITQEALSFIKTAAEGYPEENLVVSFSGGKDSTVTADLAVRALSDPYLVHIFGDTTLEFPSTLEYAARFRESHPQAIFKTARNREQSFYGVAEEIGPPARMMRWCCSMFKTGPITRVFNGLYGNQSILTFQGVRKDESVTRSKYNRIEDSAEAVKIQKQRVALPIFCWRDIDVWLYILGEGIDFNDAYRLGYERVGCWCCPNNNFRAQFLSQIYMPEQSERWRDFLIDFARRIGKVDAEVYVDTGKWKARQGGNGLAAAESIKVEASQCATEDNAMVFSLTRPYSDELVNLLCPIGVYAPGLGRKLLNEKVLLDPKTKEPLIAIMPFALAGYEHAAKVRFLGAGDQEALLRMVKYQIVKYNACRQCLKCESLCRFGAISIVGDLYSIDEKKCTHCRQCVTDKYLEGGCLMRKYLRTKE